MTRYDETDSSASCTLRVGDTVLGTGAFDAEGAFDNGGPRGSAGQAGNLKTVAYDTPVFVAVGTIMTLTGQADGELLRTDKFTFTRVEAPNGAPSAAALDASTVAENAAGAVIGSLSATDPENDAITFAVPVESPFEVVGGQLKLKAGAALDFEAAPTVDVEATATDGKGGSTKTTLTVTVTDVAEGPLAPNLSGEPVAENAPGAVVGILSAQSANGKAVILTADDPRFEVVDGVLKLRDGVSLDFEEAASVAVSVTADDGAVQTTGDVTVAVTDANDAPTLVSGAAIADVDLASSAGGIVDLSILGATDQDGTAPIYVVAGAGGAALPEGFAVAGTDLVVPAGAPAGTYAVEIRATDGEADSESVSFTVTVGEPAAFEPITIQAEAGRSPWPRRSTASRRRSATPATPRRAAPSRCAPTSPGRVTWTTATTLATL